MGNRKEVGTVSEDYYIMNMESVKAYSHYLVMKSQLIGLTTLDGHKPTAEEQALQCEVQRVGERIAKTLAFCPANEIASLTGFYSMLYTIGYRRLPDSSVLVRSKERLIRYWAAGDKTIEESDVYGTLLDSMQNPMIAMSDVHRQTFNNLRKEWVTTLKKYNSFPDICTYERYKRLALIMRDNVDSYFDGDSTVAKATWYEKNKITGYSTVATKILTAYRQFVRSLFPSVLSSKKMTELDVAVLKEVITRKDLDDDDRKAYQLALMLETN